jgi:protein-disulfide isomerase
MSRRRLLAVTLGLAAFAAIAFFALVGRGPAVADIMTVRADDVTIGDRDAPIVVVAYYSFTCAACAVFHTTQLPALKQRWIESGRVLLVYRDLPRGERDLAVSTLSRCAAGLHQDRYLAWLDLVFARQPEWSSRPEPLSTLFALARETDFVGFDRFQLCQGNPATEAAVLDSVTRAERAGVRTVPTIFVQGRRAEGALPARRVAPADLERALAAAAN